MSKVAGFGKVPVLSRSFTGGDASYLLAKRICMAGVEFMRAGVGWMGFDDGIPHLNGSYQLAMDALCHLEMMHLYILSRTNLESILASVNTDLEMMLSPSQPDRFLS